VNLLVTLFAYSHEIEEQFVSKTLVRQMMNFDSRTISAAFTHAMTTPKYLVAKLLPLL